MSKARGLADLGNVYNDGALSNRNLIINGAMQVAQRGTSTTGVTTSDGYYACDRWYTQTDTGTWTISQSTDAPSGFAYSIKMDCTTAGSSNGDEIGLRARLEGQNLQGLSYGTADAKDVTVSFWVKSNQTGTYCVTFWNLNSTQARNVSQTYTINTANTWEYKTLTIAGDTSYGINNSNAADFQLIWYFGAASGFTSGTHNTTAWANEDYSTFVNSNIVGLGGSTSDYVQITGVQLEVGDTATPFEHPRSYGDELARCQRYYQTDKMYLQAYQAAPNDYTTTYQYPVVMRTSPTLSFIAAADISTNVNVGTAGPVPNASYGKQARFYVDPASTGYIEYNRAFEADAEL